MQTSLIPSYASLRGVSSAKQQKGLRNDLIIIINLIIHPFKFRQASYIKPLPYKPEEENHVSYLFFVDQRNNNCREKEIEG
jgi:hypothetical protein